MADNIIEFKRFKIERNKTKHCSCKDKKIVLDVENRAVECEQCGSVLDPFESLLYIAENDAGNERYIERLNAATTYAKEEWKKYVPATNALKALNNFEKQNSGKIVRNYPACPSCNELFKLEEIASKWHFNALSERRLRKRLKEK